jgi:hypothetical protein
MNYDNELRQQISEIACQFKLFECNACALGIQEFLILREFLEKG